MAELKARADIHLDPATNQVVVPTSTNFKGGMIFIRAEFESIHATDQLWLCLNDVQPAVPSLIEIEFFSIDGLKQVLGASKNELFTTKSCKIDNSRLEIIQNGTTDHQVAWKNELLFIDTGHQPSFELVTIQLKAFSFAGFGSTIDLRIKMNGCRSTNFIVRNIKSVKLFAFNQIHAPLQFQVTSNQTQCPIIKEFLEVRRDG